MPVCEQNHYQILGLSPFATRAEIERAYAESRRRSGPDSTDRIRLERAYFVLSDARLKRRYDQRIDEPGPLAMRLPRLHATLTPLLGRLLPASPGDDESRAERLRLLVVLAAALVVVGGWACWQTLGWSLTTWPAGTDLVYRHDGRDFATVLEHQAEHRFPGGQARAAYRVRLPAGEERWLSQEEVFRLARPRTGAAAATGATP